MAKIKYKGKLKALRRHVYDIDGVFVVKRKWVLTYLSPKELRRFASKYKWRIKYADCQCVLCKDRHVNKSKFTKWAYWWDLEKLLQGD